MRFSLIALLMTGTAASAQITGETVTYDIGGTTFEGYVAHNPSLETPRGTVLIVHDWDGLTDYEMRRADMLAGLGYTAFAIDVYGADEDPQGIDDYRRLSGQMYSDRDLFRERLLGAVEQASQIPGATDDMVMIGYCFGGAAVLEAARGGADLDGFVSFHGGLGTPEGQDWASVSGPIQFFHGSADPVSGMADLAQTLNELQEAGVQHGAEVFGGARHSFTVWGSGDYDPVADQGSWDGFLGFLDETL